MSRTNLKEAYFRGLVPLPNTFVVVEMTEEEAREFVKLAISSEKLIKSAECIREQLPERRKNDRRKA